MFERKYETCDEENQRYKCPRLKKSQIIKTNLQNKAHADILNA